LIFETAQKRHELFMLGGPIRMFNRSRFFVNGILFWR